MKPPSKPKEPEIKEANPYEPDGASCPHRKDEFGHIVEKPFFNPRCKKCIDCMWYNNSPLQCPITKQKCFGGDVINDERTGL